MEMLSRSIIVISPDKNNLRSKSSNFIGFCTCSRRRHSWGHYWAFWVLTALITWWKPDSFPLLSYVLLVVHVGRTPSAKPDAHHLLNDSDPGSQNRLKFAAAKPRHVYPTRDNHRKHPLLTKLAVTGPSWSQITGAVRELVPRRWQIDDAPIPHWKKRHTLPAKPHFSAESRAVKKSRNAAFFSWAHLICWSRSNSFASTPCDVLASAHQSRRKCPL